MTAPIGDEGHVALSRVALAFGRRVVFRELCCEFPRGRISVIMGGSGSGKSTILRLIGGLLRPDSGQVMVAGTDVASLGERELGTLRQRLGMQFQNGALLDSMTVFENIALPLREHARLSEAEIRERVHERLAAVGLIDIGGLLPGELSGGMLRRVAFARAIVMAPEIVLCDEPFSGLDPPNVSRIEALLIRLNREHGLTVIVTSHHMATSLRMAERLVLLQDGQALAGSPAELAASRDSAIAEFVGEDGAAFLARLHASVAAPGGSPR